MKNGIEYVMWRRVNSYLQEFGAFGTCAENGQLPQFITENVFYKLCFKASNETARAFQDKVTDEVLPSIRKYGAYMTPATIEKALYNPDFLISLAKELKAERERANALEAQAAADAPKIHFANSVTASEGTVLIREVAKVLKQSGYDTGEKRFYERLRKDGYLIKAKGRDYNRPTQRSMELGLFEVEETVTQHSNGAPFVHFVTRVTGRGQQYFINKYAPALKVVGWQG